MKSNKGSGLGDHPIIIIISLIASFIAIFVFVTGLQNIGQLSNISKNQPSSTVQNPSLVTITRASMPTSTDINRVAGDWVQVGLVGDTVSDIAFTNGTLYVSTNGLSHGIFKSNDDGNNWNAINNGLGDLDVRNLIVAPANPNLLYASTEQGVWRTSDGGQSWFPTKAPDPAIAIASMSGNIMYSPVRYMKIMKSLDSGDSWTISSSNFGWCDRMYSDPANWTRLYCLSYSDNKMYKSQDGGVNWLSMASVGAQFSVQELAVSLENADILYTCTKERGIYKSADNGGSWIPVNSNLPNQGSNLRCTAILVDSNHSATVYAAFDEWGPWRTPDGGKTWESIGRGWDNQISILALCFKSNNNRL